MSVRMNHSNPFGGRTVGKPRNAFAAEDPTQTSNNPFTTGLGGPFPRPDMVRNDGSMKGTGFLGPIPNTRGQSMTEFSIGVEFDGKEMEIPTMVPTLTPQEIRYLTSMEAGAPIPRSIQQKAVDHALGRIRQGQSPFANHGPEHARRRF